MQTIKRASNILFYYGIFVSACSAYVVAGIISSPSEAESALIFGLSLPRLIMALGLLSAFIFFTSIAWRARQNREWADKLIERWFGGKGFSQGLSWLSGISLGLGLIGRFLPTYRFGLWSGYWERVQPVMMFILLAGLATWIVFWVIRVKNLNLKALTVGLPLFGACLIIGISMFTSRFGVAALEDFWYGAGVPILVLQLGAAILGGTLFLRFSSLLKSKRADMWICISLFVITAFLWAREPLQRSFLFTKPYAPDHELFPFADAALFDAASQFSLIGENFRIFSSQFFERPLYLAFMAYLHAFFGQDYEMLMALQAGLFAVMPVLIYLIGRSLGARAIGFGAALIATFRGINSIHASNMLDTAGPKMILTDFPTAIGVAVITLLVCEWWKDPEARKQHPLWIGGLIGATMMLRTNGLILFAFVPFIALFLFAGKWRQWIVSSLLILAGVLAITLPWELRNVSLGMNMYDPIVAKFRGVIQSRYQTSPIPVTQPGLAPLPNSNINPACNNVVCFSANHLLHNIITSVLILPTSPMMDDARHLINERAPYWNPFWAGSLTSSASFMLVLNLFFITTGILRAWQEKRMQALLPLAIYLAYNISNALARTSGGRYIVPTDWIITFYYLVGIFHIVTWFANEMQQAWNLFTTDNINPPTHQKTYTLKSLNVVTSLLVIGALLPISENLRPPRYQDLDPLATMTENRALVESLNMQVYDLETFLQNPEAALVVGRVLYPRYYKANQGEFVDAFYPYHTLGFPRIAFKLIGPNGDHAIVLPTADVPENIHHVSDVLVLGCAGKNYFDALVVIVLNENKAVYTRSPASELQCPLQQPVCDNNSVCK